MVRKAHPTARVITLYSTVKDRANVSMAKVAAIYGRTTLSKIVNNLSSAPEIWNNPSIDK
jgi:hypothetical protein